MKGHSNSCSCTNCAYRSYSMRSSVQQLLDEGHRIDKLFYGKYLPLRERKLLEKLIRTRAVYDGVRDQLLSTSGSSDRSRSEYTFKSQGDDSVTMSRTVSKLVSLIDRGQIRSSHATLSSCCNCCSCSSLKKIKKDMKKHPHVYNKPHVPYESIAKYKLRAEKRGRTKRKRIGSKMKDVRFKSKNIYSESCLCPKSLVDMVKHPGKTKNKKAKRKQSKEDETISLASSTSYTGVTPKLKRPLLKSGQSRKSVSSETPKRFPIMKDSLTLYREKIRRKRGRKAKAKDKALEVCDSRTCKRIRRRIKKLGKVDLLCEPGTCDIGECNPEDCLKIKEASKKRRTSEDWERIRRRIKKLGKVDLLCESGICDIGECNPEDCLKIKEASKKKLTPGDSERIRRRIKKLGKVDLLCDPGICDVEECNPEDCLEIKEANKKRRPSENWERIRRRIKKLGKVDLLCEPGICDVEECDPEDCLEIKEASKKRPPLEDWECEPGICVPDECDPKICYKKILARHGGSPKRRRGHHKTSGLSKADSSILTALTNSKTSATGTNANITKSTMPKRLKAIRHKSSQSRMSLSIKSHQIEHTLKRCFCTLKLQKNRHNLKRIRSKKTMASLSIQFDNKIDRGRKTQTKSAGIAYVVPPMGTPARRLLPYECEPFFCTPEKCDPYVCEKRIQSRYHSEVTHEDGMQTYKKVTRMNTKGIKVHKPHVRYTRSQTIKSEKVKHTTPFLRRCFCTLKLFNKDKAKRKAGTVTPPRKVTKPYKKKMRNKHSETSLSTKSSYTEKSKSDISSEKIQLKTQKPDKKLRKIDSNLKGTDKINIHSSSSNKQAVRIGSSFSFNIEFYKEKIPLNNNQEVLEKPKFHRKQLHNTSDRMNMRETKKPRKAIKTKGSLQSNSNLNYKSNVKSDVKVKEKGVFVGPATPTCFCTLKLQKKGKHLRMPDQSYETSKGTATTLELYGPKHNSECKSTSTNKSFRYDSRSFCVPATCDAYESYEEMKRRGIKRFRNSGIATEKRKRKSTISMTYNGLSSSFKARGTQSFEAEDIHTPHQNKKKYWKGPSRQAVRIGSKFSFNIDFYKDRSAVAATNLKNKDSIIESDENPKLEPNSLKEQRSHASSVQKEASIVGHKLKRCFCTMKFQRKNNTEKDNSRNSHWSSPVTALFMHIAKRDDNNNKPITENSKINQLSVGDKQHLKKSSNNETEKRNETTSKLQNIHSGSNIFNRCVSKIRLKAQSFVRVNSDIKNLHLTSSINVQIDSTKNRHLTTVSRQLNQYQVGYLFNSNYTRSIQSNFYRSYYALNLKVSQMPKEESTNNCNDTNCKFLDRFRASKQISTAGKYNLSDSKVKDQSKSSRPTGTTNKYKYNKLKNRFRSSRQIETDSVRTRDSVSTTRPKTHKAAMTTRSPKSQRAHERRDSKKSKDNSFNPGKRITNFGSTMHYSLKFYKDTSSKIINEAAQLNKRHPSQSDNLNRHSNIYSNSINMMRKCFCTRGMQNRRRSVKSEHSIDQLRTRRQIRNPYSNNRLRDSQGYSKRNSHPNVSCTCNKRRPDKCECSAGDYFTEKSKKKKRGKKVTCLCKSHPEAQTRTMDECDPNECRQLFQQLMNRAQEPDSRKDYVTDVNKKKRFRSIMSFRKDPYSSGKRKPCSTGSCKSLSMMKDKTKLATQHKRRPKEYNSDEYEKKTQRVPKRNQEQVSDGDMTANKKRSFLSKRRGVNQVPAKDKIKIEQYKRLLDECDPQECVRIMEKVLKTHRAQGSAGDYVNEVCDQERTDNQMTTNKKRRHLSTTSDNNIAGYQTMRRDDKRQEYKRLSCKCDKAMKKDKKKSGKRRISCKCDKKKTKPGKKRVSCTCGAQEYKRNLEQDFVGDRSNVASTKSRFKSIRTDRSIRKSRHKEIPEMPEELKKIVMRPPKSDSIKYGSNFSINIEFFKDSVSDIYPPSSGPEHLGQIRKSHYDEKGSSKYNENHQNINSMRTGQGRQGEPSAVSQAFRNCYCSVKSFLGDRGDGPEEKEGITGKRKKKQNLKDPSKKKNQMKIKGKPDGVKDQCFCEKKKNKDTTLTPVGSFIRRYLCKNQNLQGTKSIYKLPNVQDRKALQSQPSTDTTSPNYKINRKCVCKLLGLQDRKMLQPKPSTSTIPSKKKKNKNDKKSANKKIPEVICQPPSEQSDFLDTIMPYSKKKFKKQKSKTKLIDSPCGVCPESTCPDCERDDTSKERKSTQKKSGLNSTCLCPKYVTCPNYDSNTGTITKIIRTVFRLVTIVKETIKSDEKKADIILRCPEHGLCGPTKEKKNKRKKKKSDEKSGEGISRKCPDFDKCGTKAMEEEIKSGKREKKSDKKKSNKKKSNKKKSDKKKSGKKKPDQTDDDDDDDEDSSEEEPMPRLNLVDADTSDENKLVKTKEVCIKVPTCNVKAMLDKVSGKKSDTELKPVFEMIVDTQTMDLRNKDEILQDILSGNIKTKGYDYDTMPGTNVQGVTVHQEKTATTNGKKDKKVKKDKKDKKVKKGKQKTKTVAPEVPTSEAMTDDTPQGKTQHEIAKTVKTRHPRGCKCCDCRHISKDQQKDTSSRSRKKTKGGRMHVKPCSCRATVCEKESERMRKLYALSANTIRLKECVCGSDLCRKIAKVEAQDLQLNYKKQKQAEKRKLRDRERRLQRYKKEDMMIRKQRKKRDKKAMNSINQKTADIVLFSDSLIDVVKFGSTATCGVLRSTARAVKRPDDALYRFKKGLENPAKAFANISDIIFKHSGISRLGARLARRFASMRSTKIVVTEMEYHPITNMIAHVGSKHKPKPKPRPRTPQNFNCSPYMGSLRQKPCIWVYYLCPWFYPQCIGCLGIWRQFTDLLLFLLAIAVWSPCILALAKGQAAPVMEFATHKKKGKKKRTTEQKTEEPLRTSDNPPEIHHISPYHPLKPPKTRHPRGCKCCDCRHLSKEQKREMSSTSKSKRKAMLRMRPCSCGATICEKESDKMRKMYAEVAQTHKKKKECVCGSDVCKTRANIEAVDLKLSYKKQKQAEKLKLSDRENRLKQYKKEDEKIRKARRKKDKKEMNRVSGMSKTADIVLFGDSLIDVAKFSRTATCGVVGSTVRALKRPDDAFYRFKRGLKHPADAFNNILDIIFEHSGIKQLGARIARRFKAMRATKIVIAEMEYHPVTNIIAHMGDKSKPKSKPRPRTPMDFNCSPYMGSLRQKPCLWIYYICPWFYPHCIGCLGIWRQFTDVLLFLLAIAVWSPCILGMEIARGLMCCLVCTA